MNRFFQFDTMSTPTSSVHDSADAGAVAVAAAVPSLPAADVDAAAFRPQGVIIHLTPMASRPRFSVQVRLGNGEDCPVVRPPATVWFNSEGRLMAVASPMTDSDAEEFEDKKQQEKEEPIDVDETDDDKKSKNKPEPEVINIADDDDDDVVCLN